jgi:hypothetical protein
VVGLSVSRPARGGLQDTLPQPVEERTEADTAAKLDDVMEAVRADPNVLRRLLTRGKYQNGLWARVVADEPARPAT